ncbi:MAG: hypothetical protein VYE77_00210 [Planctomycetota bacterium]|nr:hypothetical protein [Planctomycetota bacterium]
MMILRVAGLFALTLSLPAQEGQAPKRSMADGQVRQWIEREQLRPPLLQSGVELGQGKGPMVLMIWRPGGSVSLHELQRGHEDFGPAAKKRVVESEEVEEVEIEEAEEEGVEEIEEVEVADAGADAEGQQQAPDNAPNLVARVAMRRDGDHLVIEVPGHPGAIRGAGVDRAALSSALRKRLGRQLLRANHRPELVLEVQPDVSMADLLAAWEVAQVVGCAPTFGGGQHKPIDPDVQERLLGLPKKFAWPVELFSFPGHEQPVSDGELLVLIDGEATWGQVAPLIVVCAKAGIWQIAFVGQRDAKTRCKLPTHLPFDRGLVK